MKTINTYIHNFPNAVDPIGKDISGKDVPLPAQKEVIPKVVDEKLEMLQQNPDLRLAAKVWRSNSGRLFLQDGQHRFVASSKMGRPIELQEVKLGARTGVDSWKETHTADITPAKEKNQGTLSSRLARHGLCSLTLYNQKHLFHPNNLKR